MHIDLGLLYFLTSWNPAAVYKSNDVVLSLDVVSLYMTFYVSGKPLCIKILTVIIIDSPEFIWLFHGIVLLLL